MKKTFKIETRKFIFIVSMGQSFVSTVGFTITICRWKYYLDKLTFMSEESNKLTVVFKKAFFKK